MAVSSSSSSSLKFDVLSKACESRFVCGHGNHREEVKKNQYILRRALVEIEQQVKDKATHESSNGLRCSWLLSLELELNYAFIHLLPFLKRSLMNVMHDDFVSAVHDAERFLRDYSNIEQIGPDELLGSVDDGHCSSVNIARLRLREWARTVSDLGLDFIGEVIVCPSNSALISIVSDAAKEYGETTTGLARWVDEKVIPVLVKMLVEDDEFDFVQNKKALYIETRGEAGELLFRLDSACPTVAASVL